MASAHSRHRAAGLQTRSAGQSRRTSCDERLAAWLSRRRVVGAVGRLRRRLVVFDVLGADGGPHEDEIVLEIAAVQDFGGDRIEKGLGQLGLVVVHQQADVMQLDLVPHVHGLLAGLELASPAGSTHSSHAQVVELDALALGALLAVPVGGFEAVLGARRLGAEQPVVAVEAVHHRLGDVVGHGGVQALGEHGMAVGSASGCGRGTLSWHADSGRWPCGTGHRAALSAVACRHLQVLQQAVVARHRPSHAPLTFWPRAQASSSRWLRHIDHLLDHVELAQRIGAHRLGQAVQQLRGGGARTSWTWRIQLSARPMRAPSSAACTPPQP